MWVGAPSCINTVVLRHPRCWSCGIMKLNSTCQYFLAVTEQVTDLVNLDSLKKSESIMKEAIKSYHIDFQWMQRNLLIRFSVIKSNSYVYWQSHWDINRPQSLHRMFQGHALSTFIQAKNRCVKCKWISALSGRSCNTWVILYGKNFNILWSWIWHIQLPGLPEYCYTYSSCNMFKFFIWYWFASLS